MAKKIKDTKADKENKDIVYGDPEYLPGDDIYSKEEKVELDEEDEGPKKPKGHTGKIRTGEDLDVPGAEADDADEEIGEEDEENNYYSLGGDDHDDLEEDKGE